MRKEFAFLSTRLHMHNVSVFFSSDRLESFVDFLTSLSRRVYS